MRKTTAIIIAMLVCACMAGCAKAAAEQPADEPRQEAMEASDTALEEAVEDAEQPVEEVVEEEAEEPCYDEPEPIYEEVFYEDYCEPVYCDYGGYSGSDATTLGDLLNGQGRAYDENGTSYTWYYHDLGNGALDIPGETFDADGVSHDEDGYIVVATDAYERGTVIETPYGDAKVYDSGCGSAIDIYTNR